MNIRIIVQDRQTRKKHVEAMVSGTEYGDRVASVLFKEFPTMLVSVDNNNGDPLEYLTPSATAHSITRS